MAEQSWVFRAVEPKPPVEPVQDKICPSISGSFWSTLCAGAGWIEEQKWFTPAVAGFTFLSALRQQDENALRHQEIIRFLREIQSDIEQLVILAQTEQTAVVLAAITNLRDVTDPSLTTTASINLIQESNFAWEWTKQLYVSYISSGHFQRAYEMARFLTILAPLMEAAKERSGVQEHKFYFQELHDLIDGSTAPINTGTSTLTPDHPNYQEAIRIFSTPARIEQWLGDWTANALNGWFFKQHLVVRGRFVETISGHYYTSSLFVKIPNLAADVLGIIDTVGLFTEIEFPLSSQGTTFDLRYYENMMKQFSDSILYVPKFMLLDRNLTNLKHALTPALGLTG